MRELSGKMEDATSTQRLAMAVVVSAFTDSDSAKRMVARMKRRTFMKKSAHESFRRRYFGLVDDFEFIDSGDLDEWLKVFPGVDADRVREKFHHDFAGVLDDMREQAGRLNVSLRRAQLEREEAA